MALTVGVLALVEAKPGKEAEVEAFLESGRSIVEQEPGTVVWYAFRVDGSTFGIFDAFADDEGRQAHLSGLIPAAPADRSDRSCWRRIRTSGWSTCWR